MRRIGNRRVHFRGLVVFADHGNTLFLKIMPLARANTQAAMLRGAERQLRALLPDDWQLSRQERRDDAVDARLAVGPEADDTATLLVEAKLRFGPRDVAPLEARWAGQSDPVLLAAPYLSARTRELLETVG